MGVVVERIAADEAIKVTEVRTATEEEVAAVFISASKTKVPVLDRHHHPPCLQLWRIRCKQHLPPMLSIYYQF